MYSIRVYDSATGTEKIIGIFVVAKNSRDIIAYIPPEYQIKRPLPEKSVIN